LSEDEKKEKSFRFLTPVEMLPLRPDQRGIYDSILDEFIKSGLKYAEVVDIGKKLENVSVMLKLRKKKRHIENVDIEVRNKKVYLVKSDATADPTLSSSVEIQLAKHPDARRGLSPGIKPLIDVTTLSSGIIIKLRCPKCKALNTKDNRRCRDCGAEFYKDEQEYYESVKSMEKLEIELNWERK
jgi:hypothetical protein